MRTEKGTFTTVLGDEALALYVEEMDDGFAVLDLAFLQRVPDLPALDDEAVFHACLTHMLAAGILPPADEALLPAVVPAPCVELARAEAAVALGCLDNAETVVRDVLGDDVLLLSCQPDALARAKALAAAIAAKPGARAALLRHHGLIGWGQDAREAGEIIDLLEERADAWLAAAVPPAAPAGAHEDAVARLTAAAPIVRGCLAMPVGDPDHPYLSVILSSLAAPEINAVLETDDGKSLALTPALSADDARLTGVVPLWLDAPAYDDPAALHAALTEAIVRYAELLPGHPMPRVVILPGAGLFAAGQDIDEAGETLARAAQTLLRKRQLAARGAWSGIPVSLQPAPEPRDACDCCPLGAKVALVTGAAGAIGTGISRGLLAERCHVAVTDLAGPNLESLVEELQADFGDRVIGVVMDVTDADSVAAGFATVARQWGGVDIAVVNAGVAHVSPLASMKLETFQRLERINVDGTLLTIREAANQMTLQGTGGDIVLVSTKNVFAPGATFGAYSATKAAAHQLARIASQELAPAGIRVNMVAPDAVFSEGARKSGLWQEVGPDRMRARGLDEKGLEDYYQSRNLLKARVTAAHVAHAVLFFVTHQTPTTGATIPVDGGLPDATPR